MFEIITKKTSWNELKGEQYLFLLKNLNILKTVLILGATKYTVRVECDGEMMKFKKHNVVVFPLELEGLLTLSLEKFNMATQEIATLTRKYAIKVS